MRQQKRMQKIIAKRAIQEADIEFMSRLMQQQPKLTLTELRICALIEHGLTSREIAAKLDSSLRNIENHRYRIRKKLAIKVESNLYASLHHNINGKQRRNRQ